VCPSLCLRPYRLTPLNSFLHFMLNIFSSVCISVLPLFQSFVTSNIWISFSLLLRKQFPPGPLPSLLSLSLITPCTCVPPSTCKTARLTQTGVFLLPHDLSLSTTYSSPLTFLPSASFASCTDDSTVQVVYSSCFLVGCLA